MKQLLTALALIAVVGVSAQTNTFPSSGTAGIGTISPDASSILELKSTKKGLLIPRMTQKQRNTIVSPALGLLIFQTNNLSGFYYYNDSGWVPVTPPSYAWSVIGNSSTDPSINFIGTTDAHPLVFKVNNKRSGYLDYNAANTSYGYQSLLSNTGSYNTAIGANALMNNTTGYNNTANGSYSLLSNTEGVLNTAAGSDALHDNTLGTNNTALGATALYHNINGNYNTAAGVNAGFLTGGSNNTAIGYQSMHGSLLFDYVTRGNGNTATGYQSMYNNYNGNYNTAMGYQAFSGNQQGSFNTAVGSSALSYNLTGGNNTAVGYISLQNNSSGHDNTAVGYQALGFNTNDYNTAVGYAALLNNSTGYNNTSIGIGADVSENNFYNASVIGANAIVNASNKIRLGDGGVTVVESNAGSWTVSDGRFKINIKDNVKGLEFIKLLKPVTYNFDAKKFEAFLMQNYSDSIKEKRIAAIDKDNATSKSSAILQSGFVAQDVAAAAKKIGYDFNGVHAPENSSDNWSLSYEKLVVPLVKAVQELSKMNDEKDASIQSLQAENLNLEQRLAKLEVLLNVSSLSINNSSLSQNIPNPFTNTTSISYSLSQKFSSAKIIITDKNGKTLKAINVANSKGNVKVDASTLASGAYQYSLYADGKLIDTKQMVLSR